MAYRARKAGFALVAALCSGAMLSGCGETEKKAKAPKLTVVGKEDGVEVQLFQNVFACEKRTDFSRMECADMRQVGMERAAREAPRYEALIDCEAVHGDGKCIASKVEVPGMGRPAWYAPYPIAVAWREGSDSMAPVFAAKNGGYISTDKQQLGYSGEKGVYYAPAAVLAVAAAAAPTFNEASDKARERGLGDDGRAWTMTEREIEEKKREKKERRRNRKKGKKKG